jgi:hypothetical protein
MMHRTQITERIKLNEATPEQWDSAWKASYKSNTVNNTVETFKKITEELETFDAVNNPVHYNSGKIECIDAMQSMLSPEEFIGYLRGNSFKYRWRYPDKNGIEDISKAGWYENKLLEVLGSNGQ